MQPKFSEQKTTQTEKVVTTHKRERVDSQWVPESKSRSHTVQRINSYSCFFPTKLNLGRVEQHFTFLSCPGTTDGDLGEPSLVRILTLGWLLPV